MHPALRSVVRAMPDSVRQRALRGAGVIRRKFFDVPDPIHDLVRLSRRLKIDQLLDIGAHVGQTSRELSRLYPTATISAFEPTPNTFKTLTANLAKLPKVTAFNLALSDRDGEADFNVSRNSQANSLLENDTDNLQGMRDAVEVVDKVKVKCQTLDSWLAKQRLSSPLAIKMDVQGAELLALRGASNALKNQIQIIMTEISIGRLYAGQADLFSVHEHLTSNYDFDMYQIYRNRCDQDGRALWADALWIRRGTLTKAVAS